MTDKEKRLLKRVLSCYLLSELKGRCNETGLSDFQLSEFKNGEFVWTYKGDKRRISDRVNCTPIFRPWNTLTEEIEYKGERFVPNDVLIQLGYFSKYTVFTDFTVKNQAFGGILILSQWGYNAHQVPDHLCIYEK